MAHNPAALFTRRWYSRWNIKFITKGNFLKRFIKISSKRFTEISSKRFIKLHSFEINWVYLILHSGNFCKLVNICEWCACVADCPAISFVFVGWQMIIRNPSQFNLEINQRACSWICTKYKEKWQFQLVVYCKAIQDKKLCSWFCTISTDFAQFQLVVYYKAVQLILQGNEGWKDERGSCVDVLFSSLCLPPSYTSHLCDI